MLLYIIIGVIAIVIFVKYKNMQEARTGSATENPQSTVDLYKFRPHLRVLFKQMASGDAEALKVLERLGLISLRYQHVDLNKFLELDIKGQQITLLYRAVGRDIMKLAAATASMSEMKNLLRHIEQSSQVTNSVSQVPAQLYTATNKPDTSSSPSITGKKQIRIGETTKLSATPSGGNWTSSDPAKAIVSGTTGIVTGISTGSVRIRYWTGHTSLAAWVDVH